VADAPELAVIIGAYRRETFLLSAVRSVLDQSLSRDRYEVFVTKSFRREDVDRFLADHRIPTALDDEGRIGPWLLRAVRATTAPLIAFLDDDDEFERTRLADVLEVFRTHPDVGFYRNRVRVIDGDGAPVPNERWRPHERDESFDRSGPIYLPADKKSSLPGLFRSIPGIAFNSSTMVVRRELVNGAFSATFARSQLPDLAVFLLGAVGPWGVYLDDRRLTRFRYYGENVTHRVGWLRHAAEAHRDLAAFARERGNVELAAALSSESEHYFRLYLGGTVTSQVADGATPGEVARSAAEYLRYLGRHPAERSWTLDVWAALAYAAAYPAAPGIVRRLQARRFTRRVD